MPADSFHCNILVADDPINLSSVNEDLSQRFKAFNQAAHEMSGRCSSRTSGLPMSIQTLRLSSGRRPVNPNKPECGFGFQKHSIAGLRFLRGCPSIAFAGKLLQAACDAYTRHGILFMCLTGELRLCSRAQTVPFKDEKFLGLRRVVLGFRVLRLGMNTPITLI